MGNGFKTKFEHSGVDLRSQPCPDHLKTMHIGTVLYRQV